MNKIYHYVICFMLFVTKGYCQTAINNTLTKDYVIVKGTKVSLVPPKNFTPAKNFWGFEDIKNNASITITEIPSPFETVSKTVSKANFYNQGIIISQIEDFILNKAPAKFAVGKLDVYGTTYEKNIIFIGNNKETIVITGVYPVYLNKMGDIIRTAIFSSIYNEEKLVNPLDGVDFKIDLLNYNLKFAKNLPNALIYNAEGKLPSKIANKTLLSISKNYSKITLKDRQSFALDKLQQLFNIKNTQEINDITIDNLSGFEIIANATNKATNAPEKIYQTILYGDDFYYLITGSTNLRFQTNTKMFKKIANTFKRK